MQDYPPAHCYDYLSLFPINDNLPSPEYVETKLHKLIMYRMTYDFKMPKDRFYFGEKDAAVLLKELNRLREMIEYLSIKG